MLNWFSKKQKVSSRAQEIIWNLINDQNDTIRITAFDKIKKIIDVDKTFGYKILAHVIDKNQDPKVVERAKALKERVGEVLNQILSLSITQNVNPKFAPQIGTYFY